MVSNVRNHFFKNVCYFCIKYYKFYLSKVNFRVTINRPRKSSDTYSSKYQTYMGQKVVITKAYGQAGRMPKRGESHIID